MAYFAVAMSRELAPFTTWVYLSAFTLIHRIAGFPDPTHHNSLLKLVQKGDRRVHALKGKRTRLPITMQVLHTLLLNLGHTSSISRKDIVKHMLAAAFTLAFFGLLWISKFTVLSIKELDPCIHPTINNIQWSSDHFILHISKSKTDQYGHGHNL